MSMLHVHAALIGRLGFFEFSYTLGHAFEALARRHIVRRIKAVFAA